MSGKSTLRNIMRHWATGVAIVASHLEADLHGMTVNSFTSISLDPPIILISLKTGSRTEGLINRSNRFSVSILSLKQEQISKHFASGSDNDRNVYLDTRELRNGSPIIKGACAWLDCNLRESIVAGTHTVMLGDVIAMEDLECDSPLLYYMGNYRRLSINE